MDARQPPLPQSRQAPAPAMHRADWAPLAGLGWAGGAWGFRTLTWECTWQPTIHRPPVAKPLPQPCTARTGLRWLGWAGLGRLGALGTLTWECTWQPTIHRPAAAKPARNPSGPCLSPPRHLCRGRLPPAAQRLRGPAQRTSPPSGLWRCGRSAGDAYIQAAGSTCKQSWINLHTRMDRRRNKPGIPRSVGAACDLAEAGRTQGQMRESLGRWGSRPASRLCRERWPSCAARASCGTMTGSHPHDLTDDDELREIRRVVRRLLYSRNPFAAQRQPASCTGCAASPDLSERDSRGER